MRKRAESRRMVFAILEEAGLGARDDRLMLASHILGHEVKSFATLSDGLMESLAVALGDWRTTEAARSATGATTIASIQHILNLALPPALHSAFEEYSETIGLRFCMPPESAFATTEISTENTYTEKDV